jgi:hypothetical protein
MSAPKTSAQIQRDLEKKYGVVPCPWWIDLASFGVTIDGTIPPIGTEIIFKCSDAKIICGVGITKENGLMKFSAAYANDSYVTRQTGKITGLMFNEAVTLWSTKGVQYDYYPFAIWKGSWNRVFISELETI